MISHSVRGRGRGAGGAVSGGRNRGEGVTGGPSWGDQKRERGIPEEFAGNHPLFLCFCLLWGGRKPTEAVMHCTAPEQRGTFQHTLFIRSLLPSDCARQGGQARYQILGTAPSPWLVEAISRRQK